MSIKSYKNAHIKFLMQCYWQGYFKIQGKHVHMELITSTIPFSLRKQWSSRQKNKQQERHSNDLIAASTWLNELLIAITSPNLGQTILFSRGWREGWNHFCSLIVFFCFLIASFGKWKEFTLALSKVSSTSWAENNFQSASLP